MGVDQQICEAQQHLVSCFVLLLFKSKSKGVCGPGFGLWPVACGLWPVACGLW
jgi:hypothetical protein